jgi:hypothetical protein
VEAAMNPVLIGPDQLEVDAVVPQCLDNQYVSDFVFAEMMRRGVDYTDPEIADLRERDFRREFIRSLVYSSQVVIQRAFFKNSDYLYKHYRSEDGGSLTAFATLLRDRAVVPFLFRESSLDDQLQFDLSDEGDRAAQALFREVGDDVVCVRLGVTPEANTAATAAMASNFGTQLSRLVHLGDDQRNAMAAELFRTTDRLHAAGGWEAFNAALDDLALQTMQLAVDLKRRGEGQVTRSHVYKATFAAPEDPESVVCGRFRRPDAANPFLFELKKYVDLVYNVNLPDHLRRYTFTPVHMPTRLALQDAPHDRYGHDAIADAVTKTDILEHVQRRFMASAQRAMSLPLLADLTIEDVAEIRALPEWAPFKDAQADILKHPLQCVEKLPAFQERFDDFQRALSGWYDRTHGRRATEARYVSFVSVALSLAGKLVVAGTNLDPEAKVASTFVTDQAVNLIPERIKGYAAKLMVAVYDIGKRRLDADRSYTIELMQSETELLREDVVDLLERVGRNEEYRGRLADQGVD